MRRNLTFAFNLVLIVAALAGGIVIGSRSGGRPADGPPPTTTGQPRQLWTCGMHPQVIQDHPGLCPICHMQLTPLRAPSESPSTAGTDHAGPTVTIDPVVIQNMGLRLGKVEQVELSSRIRVVGYLTEPEPLHRDINLRVSGWIDKLYANVDGMDVSRGQPLFDLYSPELRGAIEELISARKVNQGGGANSMPALLAGVQRKLELMGLTRQQVEELGKLDQAPASVPILAPIDGHVTQKLVYDGSAVKAGDLVMRLASRQEMWLDTQVFESQLPLIRIGDPATATVESQPGVVFNGTVHFIHPHLDPATRTARVRVLIPNPQLLLREGMYATVEISGSAGGTRVVAAPREAVIDTGTRQVVFVALGEGRFEPRQVTTGRSAEGMVQIVSGLLPGETIVTSGQFLLDSESRLKEAISKHLEAQAPATAPIAPVDVPNVDEVVEAYLGVVRILGAKQEVETPVDLKPLESAARLASQQADPAAQELLRPLIAAAGTMNQASVADQRKLLLPLSEAVLAIVDRSPPRAERIPRLFVAQCPMALDDRGAVWLQDHEEIANPYFATSMKSCGEIVRRIPVRGSQP